MWTRALVVALGLAALLTAGAAGAPAGLGRHEPGWDEVPAGWSRDGRRLVLVAVFPAPGGAAIVSPDYRASVLDVRSGRRVVVPKPPRLGRYEQHDQAAVLSPDGGTVVVERRFGLEVTDLVIAGADGSRVRRLVRPESEGNSDPAWSPDGEWIAYARGDSGLHVVHPDGSGDRRLTTGRDIGPVWAPDGKSISFTRLNKTFQRAVATVSVDDAVTRVLTPYGRYQLSDRSATHLLYTIGGDLGGRTHASIWVMSVEGSSRRRIATGYAPSFSPRGDQVAFLLGDRAGRSIGHWVVRTDGTGLRRVFARGFPWGSGAHGSVRYRPRWSPDGTRLAVTARTSCNGASVWLVAISSGSSRWLTNDCRVRGTSGGDRLSGTPDRDIVFALGGDDVVDTNPGEQHLYSGRPDSDEVYAGAGHDRVRVRLGNDIVSGGPGDDRLEGDRGFDRLLGGPGRDVVSGGAGADRVFVADGERDVVRCGAERDEVAADRLDRVSRDCERVSRR
jgi:Tol biopolymer transport system component